MDKAKYTLDRYGMFSNGALRKLIWPLIIEQALAIGVGTVDSMMISYAGEAAISGVSLVDMINNLFISIFAALATGGAVLVSQYIGHRDRDKAGEAASQLISLAFLFAAGTAFVLCLLRAPLLRLLFGSIDSDCMEAALTYFIISCFSYPFLAAYNAGAALFRAVGNSKISMSLSAIMNVVNAIGNALLIFGCHMGVAGAALSSLFSRALACVLILYSLKKSSGLPFSLRDVLRPRRNWIAKISSISLPVGIEGGIFQLGRVLVVSIIAGFGTAQIAANAVANSLDSLGCIPGQAMSLAMITVVGRALGAGNGEAADFYAHRLMRVALRLSLIANGLVLSLMPLLLDIYTLSPEARRISVILVLIHNGCAILLWPFAFVLPNVLKAAGDVKFVMVVSISSMIIFRIGLSCILGILLGWGAIGVWTAMIVDWCVRISFFVYRWKSGRWKTLRLI